MDRVHIQLTGGLLGAVVAYLVIQVILLLPLPIIWKTQQWMWIPILLITLMSIYGNRIADGFYCRHH